MNFTKVSVAGNDFILIENYDKRFKGDEHDFFQRICRRRHSIGADGVLLFNYSEHYDFSMIYYNSDGKIAEMCGNGALAAGYYAYKTVVTGRKMTFDVLGEVYQAEIALGGVRLAMHPPENIRLNPGYVDEPFLSEGGSVTVGVPHYILFTDQLNDLDVVSLGRKYRYHEGFSKEGTNVDFVQLIDNNKIKIRTYERGIESETFACGTGAVSAAIIAHKQKGIHSPVTVEAAGGSRIVEFSKDLHNLSLTGRVHLVYTGELYNND